MSDFEQDSKVICSWWLERGFELLPCQPGSKHLVSGFGVNLKRINTEQDACAWFVDRRANLSVVSPPGALLLDFDDKDLYLRWAESCDIATRTYTERTPSGGARVVFWCDVGKFNRWKNGVEQKSSALVAPSIVDGRHYLRLKKCNEILKVYDLSIFSSLTIPGFRTPYRIDVDERRERPEHISGVIERIKSDFEISQVLELYAPKTYSSLRGRGRFISGLCPLHDDRTPSFWIDLESNRWGCHGCKESGDVIDLYAKLNGLKLRDAIKHMSRGSK